MPPSKANDESDYISVRYNGSYNV